MSKPGMNVPTAVPVVYIILLYLHCNTHTDLKLCIAFLGFHITHISGLGQLGVSMEEDQTGSKPD